MSRDTIQLSIATVLNNIIDCDVPVWVYVRHSDSRVGFQLRLHNFVSHFGCIASLFFVDQIIDKLPIRFFRIQTIAALLEQSTS